MLCHDSKVVLRTPRGYDTEAVTQGILQKMFLKILQNTEENIRTGVIFIVKYASSL